MRISDRIAGQFGVMMMMMCVGMETYGKTEEVQGSWTRGRSAGGCFLCARATRHVGRKRCGDVESFEPEACSKPWGALGHGWAIKKI